MMVTFVSQCEKKALKKTRRVLDAFANRIGDNTWQTVITQEGLNAVRKLLRGTATKNTAVSCHWIRSRSRSQFLWAVGSRDKFNEQGFVPVNYTENEILQPESMWKSGEVMAILAGIAGLFHDFGKANVLFQNKLNSNHKGKSYEPYRHEWISLRVFQAFILDKTDKQWIRDLSEANNETEQAVLKRLHQDPKKGGQNPLLELPPVARMIAWLIVSHHKLPTYTGDNHPELNQIDRWMECFDAKWNSKNCDDDWGPDVVENNWIFPQGTPFNSATWQIKAAQIAEKALSCGLLFEVDWINNRFTSHLARLALMLADHYYSSGSTNKNWQDRNFNVVANTDSKRRIKQKLDEHNIGVSVNTTGIINCLPGLKLELPALSSDKRFKQKVPQSMKDQFGWQDKAFDHAIQLKEKSKTYGFFGLNMASTGKGKTRGNARIMYALSEENNCRFSIALGLRTLTLQTGDALRRHMEIDKEELAVLVGSLAVRQLFTLKQEKLEVQRDSFEESGSESASSLIEEGVELRHQLLDYKGKFSKWIEHDEKLHALIQAPVLVSTIDYLIPSTEGIRGGRQIAPMLRLLTSDLILDEPDDFSLEDLPALCRLANWAGVLGSKVLLSTATMPPAIAYALFESYQAGRQHYSEVVGEQGKTDTVCCAWFDEFNKPVSSTINSLETFKSEHTDFVKARLKNLSSEKVPLRKSKLISVEKLDKVTSIDILSNVIRSSIFRLHNNHHVIHSSGKIVSLGLVRMANINPLVAVARQLLQIAPENNFRFHFCVYHSQFPLAFRSYIENRLDEALARHDEIQWWQRSGIEAKIERHPEKNHVFVVLATPVAEVGRDHDYDWAIAEPSSMRSLIQLAGRVQRHRKQVPDSENFYILSSNRRALSGIYPAYCRPGFETKKRMFFSHDLKDILKPVYYEEINASPRIKYPDQVNPPKKSESITKFSDFVQLEHAIQYIKLFGNNNELNSANLWWKYSPTWCGVIQKLQPFRKSTPDESFCFGINYQTGEFNWQEKDTFTKPVKYIPTNKIIEDSKINIANGIQPWFQLASKAIIQNIAEQLSLPELDVCRRFTEVQLPKMSNCLENRWRFSEILGVYKDLKEEENKNDD